MIKNVLSSIIICDFTVATLDQGKIAHDKNSKVKYGMYVSDQ